MHVFQPDDMQNLFPNSKQYNFLTQYLEWFQPHNLFWTEEEKTHIFICTHMWTYINAIFRN